MAEQIINDYKDLLSAEDLSILKEFLTCVETNTFFRQGEHKCLAISGDASTGKTTLIRRIMEITKDVSTLGLSPDFEDLNSLVICHEYEKEFEPIIKQLVSGESIFSRKIYQNSKIITKNFNVIVAIYPEIDNDRFVTITLTKRFKYNEETKTLE